jgi:hypothetical protein
MSFCVTLEFCLALALARQTKRRAKNDFIMRKRCHFPERHLLLIQREYNIFLSQQNGISAGLSATEIISRTGRFEMATYYSAK